MGEGAKKQKKRQILNRLFRLLNTYNQVLLVQLENVGSNQVQDARYRLRKEGLGEMLVAKNTIFKKGFALRTGALDTTDPDYEYRKPLWNKKLANLDKLSSLCKDKVGLIFTNRDVHEVRPIIESNRRPAAARVGMVAPLDFAIAPGPTGMDPSQIAFFHALSIPTKIQKGQIEITKEFKVTTAGKKIGNSESVLLQKLNLKPFTYGLEIKYVFSDGVLLGPEVFNLSPADILGKFTKHTNTLASLALGMNYPTAVSIPHMVSNAFKNVASIALASNIKLKELANAGTAPAPQTTQKAAPAKEDKKPAAKEEPKKEEPQEEDANLGGMFDDF